LIVGFDRPETPGLFTQKVEIHDLSFVNKVLDQPCTILAKPRYRDSSQVIHYTPTGHNRAQIEFEQPQRALAAGQVLALYQGERLVGGGLYR
jgi:tRNA-specific 2-thiouridylase